MGLSPLSSRPAGGGRGVQPALAGVSGILGSEERTGSRGSPRGQGPPLEERANT